MDSHRRVRFLFASVVALTAAACGGGGGGDGDNTVRLPTGTVTESPSPAPTPATPAPPASTTGLSDPGLKLSLGLNDALMLVQAMRDAGVQAPGAAAAMALRAFDIGVEAGLANPYSCPGGGTVSAVAAATGYTYTYSGCKTGSYTFDGSASVATTKAAGVVTAFTIDFSKLNVTGASAPATITGSLECTPGTAGAAPECIAQYGSLKWGWDTAYTLTGAQGTHQCNCGAGTWNVLFEDFTATGGKAHVYATNGDYADVTRQGAKTFEATMVVNGVTKTYIVILN